MRVSYNENEKVYTAENWKERIRFQLSNVLWHSMEEGSPIPRWYLPVRRELNRDSIEVWFIALAPFAWLWYLVTNTLYVIWSDVFWWGDIVSQWKQRKSKAVVANTNKELTS